MKSDGHYRFGLGFKANTQERIQVGDFLNSLGNKKSDMIIRAVAEYMVNHPEVTNPEAVKILVQPHVTQEDVRQMLTQYFAEHSLEHRVSGQISKSSVDQDDDHGIGVMLDNLDIF